MTAARTIEEDAARVGGIICSRCGKIARLRQHPKWCTPSTSGQFERDDDDGVTARVHEVRP